MQRVRARLIRASGVYSYGAKESYMGNSRSITLAVMMVFGLAAFGVLSVKGPMTVETRAQASRETKPAEDFRAMLTRVDAAQRELQSGRPAAFKALWSHADDITLSGGFGGTIEKGWEQISRRLDWVGTQFSKGTNTIERLVANESGDLGYVVQVERIRFHVPGQAQESRRDYRVTMVFRRESEGWRIVHRQADSQMVKQGPQ
jgi:ketosteroid isomerase-like protein